MPSEPAPGGNATMAAIRTALRPALGSAAFLAAVEAAWQLHERCVSLASVLYHLKRSKLAGRGVAPHWTGGGPEEPDCARDG